MTAEIVMQDNDEQKIDEIKGTFRDMLANEINTQNVSYGYEKIIYHERLHDGRDVTTYSVGLHMDKSFVYQDDNAESLKAYLQNVIKQLLSTIPDDTSPTDMIHFAVNICDITEPGRETIIKMIFKCDILKIK